MLSPSFLALLPVARLDNLPFHLPDPPALDALLHHLFDGRAALPPFRLHREDHQYYLVFADADQVRQFMRGRDPRYRGFSLLGRWCMPHCPVLPGCRERALAYPLLQATLQLYWMQDAHCHQPLHFVSECALRAMFREWLQPDDLALFARIDLQIQQLHHLTVTVLLQLFECSPQDIARVQTWIHRSRLDTRGKHSYEMTISVPGVLQPFGADPAAPLPAAHTLGLLVQCEALYRSASQSSPFSPTFPPCNATIDSLDKYLLTD